MAEKSQSARELPPQRVGRMQRFALLSCTALLALTWFNPFDKLLLIAGTNQVQAGHVRIGSQFWEKCNVIGVEERTLCGSLTAPLDYFDHDAGAAEIALSMYPAKKLPSKGIVLINPGGPGGSGKSFVALAGATLQRLIGEDYDIVGFDPRGIGQTTPPMKCFTGQTSYTEFVRNTILDRSYDIASNLSREEAREHLVVQHTEAEALYKAQFKICEKTMGQTMKYMGTSTVVRDIDFITKSLSGGDALINFYGFSYGTILGQYLVNMLPDRVGRVVIDGVADAVAWSSQPYYTWYGQWLSSTTDAYDIFVGRCSEVGPAQCALAKHKDEEPSDIKDRIEQLIDDIYYTPLSVHDPDAPGILTAGRVRMFLLHILQTPVIWQQAATAFQEAIEGDGSLIMRSLQLNPSMDLPRSGVSCNDQLPYKAAPPEGIVDALLDVYYNVSRTVFSVVTTEPDAGCQTWPVTPPERFQGPWNQTLLNPILVLSNSADPVTPLDSGRKVVERLGNSSRLVVQDSPGHCTLAMPSQCTAEVLRAYFADGTLPPAGTVCKTIHPPFSNNSTKTLSEEPMLDSFFAEFRHTGFVQ